MQLNLYSKSAKKLNKNVKLDESVFSSGINEYLMNLAVLIYLGNQRQSNAHTKIRSEVRGGGAKPWRQKGTGRARHGSIRSPIWRGGGVTFGPRNDRNYKRKLTKKMKKAAIRSAFSFFAKEKNIVIIESIEFGKDKLTKKLIEINEKLPAKKKVLYIQDGKNRELYLASRNLKNINVVNVDEINVYKLLNHESLVILESALEKINKKWKKERSKKAVDRKHKVKKTSKKKVTKKSGKKKKVLIKETDLSKRVKSALEKENVKTTDELMEMIDKGEKIKGIGKKSLSEIKKVLEK